MSELAGESYGEGEPQLVLLHGFTQTRTSWLTIGMSLAARHRVTLIDLPEGSTVSGTVVAPVSMRGAAPGTAGGRGAMGAAGAGGGRGAVRSAM